MNKNLYKMSQHLDKKYTPSPMVLILDGNSLTGAHAKRNLCYSNCLSHLITSRPVTNRIF